MRKVVLTLVFTTIGFVVLAGLLPAQEEIFSGGFESGDLCGWTVNGAPPEECVEHTFPGTGRCRVFLYKHHEVKSANVQSEGDWWWKSLHRGSTGSWEDRMEIHQGGRLIALTFSAGWFRLNPGAYECSWSAEMFSRGRPVSIERSYDFNVTSDCEVTP